MLFSATDISLWKTDEIEEHPFLKRLGPDVLATNTDAELILTRLLGKSCRNRQLASLYLDQSFVAGLGNYLRSEILFFSGVNPADKPRNLNEAQVHALAKNTIEISQRSYRTSGVTLPKKYRPAIKKKSGRAYEQNRFAVFARAGKPCHFCATPVQKSIATSRRIYWCPQCQPRSE
jgi:endonuclease-8